MFTYTGLVIISLIAAAWVAYAIYALFIVYVKPLVQEWIRQRAEKRATKRLEEAAARRREFRRQMRKERASRPRPPHRRGISDNFIDIELGDIFEGKAEKDKAREIQGRSIGDIVEVPRTENEIWEAERAKRRAESLWIQP